MVGGRRLLPIALLMLVMSQRGGVSAQSQDYRPLPVGEPVPAPEAPTKTKSAAAAPAAKKPEGSGPAISPKPESKASEPKWGAPRGATEPTPPPAPPAPAPIDKTSPTVEKKPDTTGPLVEPPPPPTASRENKFAPVPIPDDGLGSRSKSGQAEPKSKATGDKKPSWSPPGEPGPEIPPPEPVERGTNKPTEPTPVEGPAPPAEGPQPPAPVQPAPGPGGAPGGQPAAPERSGPRPIAESGNPLAPPEEERLIIPRRSQESIAPPTPPPPARPGPMPTAPRERPVEQIVPRVRQEPPTEPLPPREPANRPLAPAPAPLAPAPSGAAPGGVPVPLPVPSSGTANNPGGTSTGSVFIEKIGPASLNVGLPLVYEIVARNPSSAAVFNVRVEDEIPPNSKLLRADPGPEVRGPRLGWTIGTLEPGGERRFKVEVQPAGEGEFASCATIAYAANSCLRTQITQPRLSLTKSGPDMVHLGDEAVFVLTMSNTGTGQANHVVLHDRLPAGLEHPSGASIDAEIGTLAQGESKQVTLRTRAVQVGRHVNQATLTADNAAPASAQAVVVAAQSALQLRKTGPQTRFLNREAEFDIEVYNPGSAPATNVRVADVLPPGLEFISADEGGTYDPNNRTVTWQIGTLAPGQRRGLSLKVYGARPGEYLNRAVGQGDRGLETVAESNIRIEGVAALMLEVVDLDDPVEVDAETSYEIRVVNQGSGPTTRLQIIATIPKGMTALSGTGPTPYRIQGQQLVFEPVPQLAARADAVFRVQVKCKEPGDWRFQVQMNCEQLQSPVFEEESTRVYRD